MNKKRIFLFLSLLFTILAVASLLSGSAFLNVEMLTGFPVPIGNLITWVGMIALPVTIYLVFKELRQPIKGFQKFLSVWIMTIISLGILWGS
jgi:hypothetical protein